MPIFFKIFSDMRLFPVDNMRRFREQKDAGNSHEKRCAELGKDISMTCAEFAEVRCAEFGASFSTF